MYLNKLSIEQKNLFLDLCIHGANANNEFADDEKAIVNAYCEEMNIPVRYDEQTPFEECVDKLVKISSEKELRELLVELTALILADNICDEYEEKFMQEFIAKAGISDSDYKKILDVLVKISALYKEIDEFVSQK